MDGDDGAAKQRPEKNKRYGDKQYLKGEDGRLEPRSGNDSNDVLGQIHAAKHRRDGDDDQEVKCFLKDVLKKRPVRNKIPRQKRHDETHEHRGKENDVFKDFIRHIIDAHIARRVKKREDKRVSFEINKNHDDRHRQRPAFAKHFFHRARAGGDMKARIFFHEIIDDGEVNEPAQNEHQQKIKDASSRHKKIPSEPSLNHSRGDIGCCRHDRLKMFLKHPHQHRGQREEEKTERRGHNALFHFGGVWRELRGTKSENKKKGEQQPPREKNRPDNPFFIRARFRDFSRENGVKPEIGEYLKYVQKRENDGILSHPGRPKRPRHQ